MTVSVINSFDFEFNVNCEQYCGRSRYAIFFDARECVQRVYVRLLSNCVLYGYLRCVNSCRHKFQCNFVCNLIGKMVVVDDDDRGDRSQFTFLPLFPLSQSVPSILFNWFSILIGSRIFTSYVHETPNSLKWNSIYQLWHWCKWNALICRWKRILGNCIELNI